MRDLLRYDGGEIRRGIARLNRALVSSVEPVAVFTKALGIVKLSLLADKIVVFCVQEIDQVPFAAHFNLEIIE